MKNVVIGAALLLAAAAGPAAGQGLWQRLSVEPYVGYGFFGELPNSAALEADLAYGGRAAFALSPQWGLFGNFQRSTPEATAGFGADSEVTVDHWSAGVEFSYVPRGGAQGMLPLLIEAGLGQARYGNAGADLAVNLGIASALQLSPNFAVRYGVNDYISNYAGDLGVVNQVFARVGAELTF